MGITVESATCFLWKLLKDVFKLQIEAKQISLLCWATYIKWIEKQNMFWDPNQSKY